MDQVAVLSGQIDYLAVQRYQISVHRQSHGTDSSPKLSHRPVPYVRSRRNLKKQKTHEKMSTEVFQNLELEAQQTFVYVSCNCASLLNSLLPTQRKRHGNLYKNMCK